MLGCPLKCGTHSPAAGLVRFPREMLQSPGGAGVGGLCRRTDLSLLGLGHLPLLCPLPSSSGAPGPAWGRWSLSTPSRTSRGIPSLPSALAGAWTCRGRWGGRGRRQKCPFFCLRFGCLQSCTSVFLAQLPLSLSICRGAVCLRGWGADRPLVYLGGWGAEWPFLYFICSVAVSLLLGSTVITHW